MTERFDLPQNPEHVPPAAVVANPIQAMRDLYGRLASLEHALAAEREQREQDRQQAADATVELLCTVLDIHDYMAETVEEFSVSTNAHESAVILRTVDLARTLQGALQGLEVEPIETLGKPVDEATSLVDASEANDSAPEGTVLREVQVGYRWPLGLIRPARVVVAGPGEPYSANHDPSAAPGAQEPE